MKRSNKNDHTILQFTINSWHTYSFFFTNFREGIKIENRKNKVPNNQNKANPAEPNQSKQKQQQQPEDEELKAKCAEIPSKRRFTDKTFAYFDWTRPVVCAQWASKQWATLWEDRSGLACS